MTTNEDLLREGECPDSGCIEPAGHTGPHSWQLTNPMTSARLAAIKTYCNPWEDFTPLSLPGVYVKDIRDLVAAYEEAMGVLKGIERDCERLHGCVSYTDMRTRDGLRMIQMRAIGIVREFEGGEGQ